MSLAGAAHYCPECLGVSSKGSGGFESSGLGYYYGLRRPVLALCSEMIPAR